MDLGERRGKRKSIKQNVGRVHTLTRSECALSLSHTTNLGTGRHRKVKSGGRQFPALAFLRQFSVYLKCLL